MRIEGKHLESAEGADEVLKATNEMNYELISDNISDDVPVTPFHSSPKITVPKLQPQEIQIKKVVR